MRTETDQACLQFVGSPTSLNVVRFMGTWTLAGRPRPSPGATSSGARDSLARTTSLPPAADVMLRNEIALALRAVYRLK